MRVYVDLVAEYRESAYVINKCMKGICVILRLRAGCTCDELVEVCGEGLSEVQGVERALARCEDKR